MVILGSEKDHLVNFELQGWSTFNLTLNSKKYQTGIFWPKIVIFGHFEGGLWVNSTCNSKKHPFAPQYQNIGPNREKLTKLQPKMLCGTIRE